MSTTSVPPRFVPTLTDVVLPSARSNGAQFDSSTPASFQAAPIANAYVPAQASDAGIFAPADDLLVQRVMQQVDMALEPRLREALSRVVADQAANLAPKLREEIELAVKETIAHSIAQELSRRQG